MFKMLKKVMDKEKADGTYKPRVRQQKAPERKGDASL
jgi:hypothetical protein